MHGGLPHRPGYAVVPELEPGAVRRAIALRGIRSRRDRRLGDRFYGSLVAELAPGSATFRSPGIRGPRRASSPPRRMSEPTLHREMAGSTRVGSRSVRGVLSVPVAGPGCGEQPTGRSYS